jgi:hypothetical protein
MLDSALGRLSLRSVSRHRRSVACPATLPARVPVSHRQSSETLADCGECGEKMPGEAIRSIPNESASLRSSPSGGTSCCPSAMLDSALGCPSLSSTSCRHRSVSELLSEHDAGLSFRSAVAELDFLSSSLSVRAVVRARCWTQL